VTGGASWLCRRHGVSRWWWNDRGRAGPAAGGWDEDQCWTLAQVADLMGRRFGVDYTLAGLDLLLHRIGWSVQRWSWLAWR
jgi:Winged helix-turn helix